jgi:hypothetical protein
MPQRDEPVVHHLRFRLVFLPFALLPVLRYSEYTTCKVLAVCRFHGRILLCCVWNLTVALPFAMV